MPGMIIGGREVHLAALADIEIVNRTDRPWAQLAPGDYGTRKTSWIRQIIVHTTQGMWPQPILGGRGRGGTDERTADYWRKDPEHSGAHLIVDNDGSIACLCDLSRHAAYHATVSNDWSIGIEMRQEPSPVGQSGKGGVYEAVIASTVRLVLALCEHFEIPLQIPGVPYKNAPLARMHGTGGKDCVGVFGHRDNTERRGRGDPGDYIFHALEVAGAERFDFDRKVDLETWRLRQKTLNRIMAEAPDGKPLDTDGIAGPATMRAMKSMGFRHGREIPIG